MLCIVQLSCVLLFVVGFTSYGQAYPHSAIQAVERALIMEMLKGNEVAEIQSTLTIILQSKGLKKTCIA